MIKSVLLLIVGVVLMFSADSCATSPGEKIGNLGCECIKQSGGDKQKMIDCVNEFQKKMVDEMKLQNSIDAERNKDADIAFLMLRNCMDEFTPKDSIHIMPPKLNPNPQKTP